jgi:hypothetical protein
MGQSMVGSDLLVLSSGTLAAFDRRVADIRRGLSAPFHEEARQLEAELLTVYRVVVLCTKKEDDLDRVAQWWGVMVRVCDEFAGRLNKLAKEFPPCGADPYYDRVLELRSKCQRLQEMHSQPPNGFRGRVRGASLRSTGPGSDDPHQHPTPVSPVEHQVVTARGEPAVNDARTHQRLGAGRTECHHAI